jgi:hypothetical protein
VPWSAAAEYLAAGRTAALRSFVIAGALGFIVSLQLAILDSVCVIGLLETGTGIVAHLFVISRLTVAVSGLVPVHIHMAVNSDPEVVWRCSPLDWRARSYVTLI